MDSLPVELKIAVASFVGDSRSLISLALVNKSFYGILKSCEAKLCGSLTSYSELTHDGLLPLAVAALNSEQCLGMNSYPVQSVASLIDEHFPDESSLNGADFSNWQNIRSCLKLDDFYRVINHYAAAITRIAGSNIPENHDNRPAFSQMELVRVRKSLCVIQLLRNLFPRNFRISPNGVMPTSQPMWRKLWSKLAPWELQQVRCAHGLLAQHLMNVVRSELQKGGKWPGSPDLRILQAFVSHWGLRGMYSIENRTSQNCAVTDAVDEFEDWAVGYNMVDPWYAIHDTMWLEKVGPFSNFNVQDVIDQYPESDSGPRDAWLHTLLQPVSNDPMFDRGAEDYFSCEIHADHRGWAFWDRKRLDEISNGSMPTTKKMLSVSTFQLETAEVLFYARLRRPKTSCTCPSELDGGDCLRY